MQKTKGALFVVISSIIFGMSPIYMKFAVAYGLNIVTFTLLRAVLVAVICLAVAHVRGVALFVTGKPLRSLLRLSLVGSGFTAFLLSLSYNYLPSGMATSLHFIYPVLVMLAGILVFKERVSPLKLAALALGVLAVVLFADPASAGFSPIGILLALISGATYAFYILYMEHSEVKDMDPIVVVFYSTLAIALTSLAYAVPTGSLEFASIRPQALLAMLLSIPFYSFIAAPMFQLGVRYTGATTSALLSTLEPATSLVCGILLLGETMDPAKLAGCLAVIVATVLVVLSSAKEKQPGEAPGRAVDVASAEGNAAPAYPEAAENEAG